MLIFNFWFSGFFPSKRGVRGVTPSCLLRGVTPTDATKLWMIYYDRVVFFTTKKTFLAIATWSSANFVIMDVIFYAFPSSFLHSVEKMSQFLIFLSISSYLWYFLIQLVFLNLICMRGFLVSPGVFMETWGLCNLRKWRKFEILIAPS